MTEFIKKEINGDEFEVLIDSKIFSKEIVLKAAYTFLDKGYFFFSLDEKKNIILQFNKKEGIKEKSENIIGDFSGELLNVYLRDKLEKDNKIIRERIVSSAINNALDYNNFVELDTNNSNNSGIDFNKDIDEILREIENDPDLKIDQEEIDRILKEIEEESDKYEEPKKEEKITIDPKKVKNAKKKFQDK